jgi:hypothetical protein
MLASCLRTLCPIDPRYSGSCVSFRLVEDDPPGCTARTAGAPIVDVRVVAAAGRIPLEPARTISADEPEVVTRIATPALVAKRGIAEDTSRVAARLAALNPELAHVGAARRART